MSAESLLAPPCPAAPPIERPVLDAARPGRLAACVELTKPRIVVMVLLTTAVGFWLGARASGHPLDIVATLLGTALVAGGASAWNQVLERARDARMRRTARRPLPAGRLDVRTAAVFSALVTLVGLGVLVLVKPLAALVALVTFALYVGVYTPAKVRTTLNTAIGAVPGALPPVIGWAAATGRLGVEAWSLFLIVFLWQFPHFLAIAWIHRDDYARAGYRMLPLFDPTGALTGRQATAYALTLLPAALLPAVVGLAGSFYFAGALAVSLYYLASAWIFWSDGTDRSARRLLRASFVHLPALLLLLVLNPLPA
jgi:protoheme IX farnesyltransferase